MFTSRLRGGVGDGDGSSIFFPLDHSHNYNLRMICVKNILMIVFLCLYMSRTETVERNAELRTKAMREAEDQKRMRRYRYCLVRIRFPDGILLQGERMNTGLFAFM